MSANKIGLTKIYEFNERGVKLKILRSEKKLWVLGLSGVSGNMISGQGDHGEMTFNFKDLAYPVRAKGRRKKK